MGRVAGREAHQLGPRIRTLVSGHWFSGMPYWMPCGVPRPVTMDTDADVDDDLICTDANIHKLSSRAMCHNRTSTYRRQMR